VPECDRAPVDGTAARRSLPPAEAAWPVSGTQRQTSTQQPAAGPGQAPVTALAHHLRDDTLASAIKVCACGRACRLIGTHLHLWVVLSALQCLYIFNYMRLRVDPDRAVQECMADSAFRRLVDRVEALWDDLGLPDEVT